ncbi:MAG: carbonic anhydrase [Turneriella sp.]
MKRVLQHKFALVVVAVLAGLLIATMASRKVSFFIGGFFLHTGYVIQDLSGSFHHEVSDHDPVHPNEIFKTIMAQNAMQARIWKVTPDQKDRKPKAVIIMCIDPRLDDNRILGDARGYYDIIRIPGSVITEEVAEAVELAVVKHAVKLVLVVTHTDCAMEKLAASEDGQHHYPLLSEGINNHSKRLQSLSHRPAILERLQKQQVWVIERRVDTKTGRFL